MKETNILPPPPPPPPPPTSVESPTLSALAELFYFRSNLITHINHHLSACHSTAPPAVESLHLIIMFTAAGNCYRRLSCTAKE